jgi:hypothetical protein
VRGVFSPRRLKRDGEVWHKNGAHGKARLYLLCLRCKTAHAHNGWGKHIRACFGFHACLVCRGPFPCTNRHCVWVFPEGPPVPAELLPYFRKNTPGKVRDLLVRPAHRWLRGVLKLGWRPVV